jgi:hypothetical protein
MFGFICPRTSDLFYLLTLEPLEVQWIIELQKKRAAGMRLIDSLFDRYPRAVKQFAETGLMEPFYPLWIWARYEWEYRRGLCHRNLLFL